VNKCKCISAGHCPWRDVITDKDEFMACREGRAVLNTEHPSKPCIYLYNLREEVLDDAPTYRCLLYDKCTLGRNNHAIPACADCKDFLHQCDPDLSSRFIDSLHVTNSKRIPSHMLRGMLAGSAVFLVCGGPSLDLVPYQRLSERGIFSLGVNNVAGKAPVNAFVCSDPPNKFHSGIFEDPKIMKFLPVPKLGRGYQRGVLRRKEKDGTFTVLKKCAIDCPNVWGFERRSWMSPDPTFFTEPSAAWGNQDAGVERVGQPKTACTMLIGIRILYYLGARTIFLLGCDFRMGAGYGYSFAQGRSKEAIDSNNEQFRIANDWFVALRPVFEKFGLQVYNCFRESSLRAFDFVPFDHALTICRGAVPDTEFDLAGWYEK